MRDLTYYPTAMTLRRIVALFVCAVFVIISPAGAEDWLHWRGASRTGVTTEISGWESGGWKPLRQAWKAGLGVGSSSPIVVGTKVYALGWGEEKEHVTCLDAASGAVVWRQSYPAPQYSRFATGDQNFYSGPSATPEYDARTGYLYTLGIDGDLHCWDTRAGGKKVWGFNLVERLKLKQRPQVTKRGGSHRDYGWTAAPLIHGEWLIVEAGSDEGCLIAFDRRTGERRWASEAKGPAGHTAGIAPISVDGVPCVAVLTLKFLLVARLDGANAGKTVATYDWVTDYGNSMATPAVDGQEVLITSGWNNMVMVKLRITMAGAAEVWKKRIFSTVGSPVIYQGHAYWADRGVQCVDLKTGELAWEGGRFENGSCLITSDGRLIVWGNNGDLSLAETRMRAPDAYRELARHSVFSQTEAWPHPVLSGGRLYVKDRAGNLQVFQVAAAP